MTVPTRSRAVLFKLVVVAASLALGLLVAEAGLRLVQPCPYLGYEYEPPQRNFFRHDDTLGWVGRPDAKGVFASRDFRVGVTHDRFGFRNLSPPHVDGKTNVLVLGDSFGWGWGVEDDETFAVRASEFDDGLNVYSIAAPGYGTGQQLIGLRRFLDEREGSGEAMPDDVVLLLYYNDLIDSVSWERYGYPKPRYVLEGDELRLENVPVPPPDVGSWDEDPGEPRRASGGLLRRSHAYNLLSNRLWARFWQPADVGGEASARPDLALSARLVEELDRVSAERGIDFHVVMLLTGATTEVWEEYLGDLAERLDAAGVEHSFFESSRVPSTDLCLDRHLNPYGHELLARHLASVVKGER